MSVSRREVRRLRSAGWEVVETGPVCGSGGCRGGW